MGCAGLVTGDGRCRSKLWSTVSWRCARPEGANEVCEVAELIPRLVSVPLQWPLATVGVM